MSDTAQSRLTVRSGDTRVAMAASEVAEILRMPRVTRVPHAPEALLGVMALRGQVLTVVSLNRLLGGAKDIVPDRVVVLRRDPPLGLAVDRIEGLRGETGADGSGEGLSGGLSLDGAQWLDLDRALDRLGSAYDRAKSPVPSAVAAPVAVAAEAASEAFLTLRLSDQVYALPLADVLEVVAPPDAVLDLPLTEDILVGVFEHRGRVTPVLSLRALLGLPVAAATRTARLIVVRIGAERFALQADAVTAILRLTEDRVGPAPRQFNLGAGEARITQVLRPPGGLALTPVLSPSALMADARAGLGDGPSLMETLPMADDTIRRRERFLVIRMGDEAYGLPLAAVDEVVRAPASLARVPKSPAYVLGAMNLRGRVVPVIDQAARFGVEAHGGAGRGRRVVVVSVGDLQAGFLVDAATEIIELDSGDLLATPDLTTDGARSFDRAAPLERNGEMILLIDPAGLLSRAESDLLRDLAGAASGS